MPAKLGIIGGGVMGEALLSRLLIEKLYEASEVIVSDPQAQRRAILAQQYGIQITDANTDAFGAEDILLLAIKPQTLAVVAPELLAFKTNTPPVMASILAGVPLARLEAMVPGWPVVRAMPNTPATVGAGVTAITAGRHVTPEHLAQVRSLFTTVGRVVEVAEPQMDAVTGLSGSGPGYMAVIIEALIDGGVAVGLPRAVATELAVQTMLGTAKLLQEKGLHPAVLKDQVTSPGGTTIAGISQMEAGGVRSAMIAAVRQAYVRSQELGQS